MRKSKALIVASVASMIDQFNMPIINLLQDLNYEVHVACNFDDAGNISKERAELLKRRLKNKGVKYFHVDFDRNPFKFKSTLSAYKQLKNILKNNYNIVHSQSPIGGALSRVASNKYRRKGLKSIYSAHGFHFHKSSSKLSWILFYPVEKILSYITDVLITTNYEDFHLAMTKFKTTNVKYVPGVGLEPIKEKLSSEEKQTLTEKMNIPSESFIISTTAELNDNKNQITIINALSLLENPKIHYLIIGKGEKERYLKDTVAKLGLENNIHFLGYRSDVMMINQIIDLFVFPTYREGLGMAALEAMLLGKPLISSNARGVIDYSIDGKTGYICNPNDVSCFAESINELFIDRNKCKNMGIEAKAQTNKFLVDNVIEEMKNIYLNLRYERKGKDEYYE